MLFCAIGVLAVLLSDAYLARRQAARGEFYGLLLLVVTGMIGMAISTDIIAFFVSFELMSLPTYILAGYIWRDERSGEASLKYFVTGAFSSAILAFGLALLYGATGATSYAGIAAGLAGLQPPASTPAASSSSPSCSSSPASASRSRPCRSTAGRPTSTRARPRRSPPSWPSASRPAAFVGFAKLFVMAAGADWARLGPRHDHPRRPHDGGRERARPAAAQPQAHARLLEHRPRRLPHAGPHRRRQDAATRSASAPILFYLAAYALMNLGAFGVLIWIRNRAPVRLLARGIAGLGRTMPWPAILMALFMVSLTGIPPTVGFWGKFYLFTAVIQADLTWLAIIAVVMSAVSAYYYLRVVWYMYFREAPEGAEVEAEPGVVAGRRHHRRHRRGARRRARRPVPRPAAGRRAGRARLLIGG